METKRTISILGHEWTVERLSRDTDPVLADHADGYSDWTRRKIVVDDGSHVGPDDLGNIELYYKKVLRHEITHAFLDECGLAECSGEVGAWARNEAMVDWIARLGPEIYAVWQEAGALDMSDALGNREGLKDYTIIVETDTADPFVLAKITAHSGAYLTDLEAECIDLSSLGPLRVRME